MVNKRSCQGHPSFGCHHGRNTAGTETEEPPDYVTHTVQLHKGLMDFLGEIVLQHRRGQHPQQSHQIVGGQASVTQG